MTIEPEHIKLKAGEVAERVIICGDPDRVKELSSLLDEPRLLHTHRFIVYSGEYKGKDVSIASHGIGGPSTAIAIEELHALGAKYIVRLGTTGGLKKDILLGDFVVASSAGSEHGGVLNSYSEGLNIAPAADFELTSAIVEELKANGKRFFVGPVFASDSFYGEDQLVERLTKLNFLSVEMECSTLFAIAQRRGFKSASLLITVDSRVNEAQKHLMDVTETHKIALEGGKVVLDALVNFR